MYTNQSAWMAKPFFIFSGLIKYRGYKARASSSESCHMSALSNEDLSNTVIQCWGRRSDTEQDLRPVWFAPEVSEGLDGARYITGASWMRTTLVWSGSRTLTRWLMVSLVWKTIIQKDSRKRASLCLIRPRYILSLSSHAVKHNRVFMW